MNLKKGNSVNNIVTTVFMGSSQNNEHPIATKAEESRMNAFTFGWLLPSLFYTDSIVFVLSCVVTNGSHAEWS